MAQDWNLKHGGCSTEIFRCGVQQVYTGQQNTVWHIIIIIIISIILIVIILIIIILILIIIIVIYMAILYERLLWQRVSNVWSYGTNKPFQLSTV